MSLYAIRLTEMGVHPNLFVSSGMGPISQAEYDANPNGYILVDWSDPNDPGQQLANANLSFEIYVKLETDEGFPWRAIDRVSTSIEGLTNTQLTQLISSSLTLPTVTDVNSLDELILRQFDSMTRSRVASGEEGDSVQVDLGRDQSNEFLLTFDYESAQGQSSTYEFRPVDFFDDVSNIRNYGSSLNDVIFNGSAVEFAITLDGESFVGRLDIDSGNVSQFIRVPFVNESYISAFSKLAVAGPETLVVTGSSLSGASIGKFTSDGEYLSVGEVGTSAKSPSIQTPYYGKKFDLAALDSGDFVFVSAEYPGYEVNAYFIDSAFETTSYLTLNDLEPSWGYASISDVQITQANNRWATVWKGDFPTGLKIVVGEGTGNNIKDIYSLTTENYDRQGILPEEYRVALNDNGALALLSRFSDRYEMTWFEDSSDLAKFHTVQIGSFEEGLSPRIQDFAIRDGVVDVVTSVATFTVPTPLLDGSVSLMLGQSETSFDKVALLLSADSESGTGELLSISMPILNFGFGPIHAIEAEITLTHQGGLVVNKTMSLSSESGDDLKSIDVQILPSASLESVTVASVTFQGSAGSVTLDQNTTPSDLFPAPSIVLPDLINPSITESLCSLKVVDGDQHVHHSSSSEFVIGDDGDDQFTVSESTVSEFFVGGDGQDSVYVHDDQLARGAVIDLASGEIVLGSGKSLAVNGVEDAYGTSHDDRLVGDSQANSLSGGLGRDVLNGGFGADTLYGGDGDDDLSGGAGSDLLIGGAGNDEIEAGHNALLELENISGSDYFRYLGGTSPREYTESYDSGTGIPMNDLGGVSIGTATSLNPSQLSVGFKVFFDHSFGSDRVDLFSGKNFVVYAIRGDVDPDGYSNSFGGEAVLHIEAFRADGTTRDSRLGSIDLGSESTVVLGIDSVNGRVSYSESGSGGGSSYIGSFEGLNPSFSAAELVLEGSTYPGDEWIAEFSWKSIDGQVVTANVSINDFSTSGGNALNAAEALVTAINADNDLPVVAGTPWSVVRPEGGADIRVPLAVDPSKGSDLFSVTFSVTDLDPNDGSATYPIDARVENISGISYEESLITLSDAASGVMLGSLSIDSFINFDPLSSSIENFNGVENWSTFYDFSNLRDVSTLKNLGYLGEAGDLEIGNSIASTALGGDISRGLDLSNVPNDSNLMLSGIGITPSGFIKAGFIFHGFESESQYSQTLYETPYISLDLVRPNDAENANSSFDLRVRYPGGEQHYTIVDLPIGDLVTVDVMYDSQPTNENDVQLALTFDPGSVGTYTGFSTPWNLAEKQTESFISADFNGQIVQLAGRNSFSYGSGSKDGREIRPIYDDSGILLSKYSIGYDYILNFDTLDGDFEVENLLGQQSNSDVNPSVTTFEGSSYVVWESVDKAASTVSTYIQKLGDQAQPPEQLSSVVVPDGKFERLKSDVALLENGEPIVVQGILDENGDATIRIGSKVIGNSQGIISDLDCELRFIPLTDGFDKVVVVWADAVGTGHASIVNLRGSKLSTSEPEQFEFGSNITNPKAVGFQDGTVAIFWEQADVSTNQVSVIGQQYSFDASGTIIPGLSTNLGRAGSGLDVVQSRHNSDTYIVFSGEDSGASSIELVAISPYGLQQIPYQILSNSTLKFANPKIAPLDTDGFVLVWEELGSDGLMRIAVQPFSFSFDGSVLPLEPLPLGDKEYLDVSSDQRSLEFSSVEAIASDGSGSYTVTWSADTGSDSDVLVQEFTYRQVEGKWTLTPVGSTTTIDVLSESFSVMSTTELNSEILMFGDRSKRSANDSDIIDGGEGYDVLSYLESSESIVLRAKDQEVEHGGWTDSYSNIEAVRGSKLGDKFLGGEESLVGHGDDGDDLILGSMADDHLYGDSGNDTIIGNNEGFLTSYELKAVVVDYGTEGWDLTRSVNSAVVEIIASDANTEFSYSIVDFLDLGYAHIKLPIIAIDDGSVGFGLRIKGQSELLDVSSMFASEVETATGGSYVLFEFAGQLGGSNTSLSLIVDGEGNFFDNIQSYDGTWGVDIESQIVSQRAISSGAYAPGAAINIQDWDILNQSTLKVGGLSDDYIDGGDGSDLLDGGGGVDYILGGDGDDQITLTADSYWGDGAIAKNTTLSELSVGAWRASSFRIEGLGKYEKVLDGGADSDTIIMGDEGEALFLHDALSDFYPDDGLNLQTDISGRDSTARVLGIETIYAGGGDDLLDMTSFDYASDTGLTAYGEDGNDTLWATELNDTLYGGMGDDTLFGDAGDDILYGGEGFDRFEFSVGAGFDQIMDFNIDEDILAFYARKSRFGSEGDDTELALSNGVVSWEDVSIDLMDDTLNNLEDLNVEFTVV